MVGPDSSEPPSTARELRVAEQIKRMVQRCIGYLAAPSARSAGRVRLCRNGFDRGMVHGGRTRLRCYEIRIGGQVFHPNSCRSAASAIAGDRDEDLAVIAV